MSITGIGYSPYAAGGAANPLLSATAFMVRAVLTCIAVVVAAGHLSGATSVDDLAPTPQYALSSWTEGDGLPANAIRALTQDGDGYLWLGTRAGLVRFDGVRFVVWEHDSNAAANGKRHHCGIRRARREFVDWVRRCRRHEPSEERPSRRVPVH